HLVLALLVVELTRGGFWDSPPALDQNMGRPMGGGGGRQVTMIALPDAPPKTQATPKVPPVKPIPVAVPTTIPPVETVPPADTIAPRPDSTATAGSGGGTGGGTGTGSGPGTGPGSGPGSGGGGGPPADSAKTAARGPEPLRVILPPFEYPRSMRGHTIAVTFFVQSDGRVDRVLFSEEISDRGYARKLEDAMRAYRFRPARSPEGKPVPGVTTVSISF
ncbi:MAG: hypothetical protein HOP28_05985, partial [Gemmatimonadales bacterium]|nr:hypothetical protein [Gemmatimonadales bacterium]